MTQDAAAPRSSYARSPEAEARLVRLADARLYLCLGLRPALPAFLDEVLAGGVDVVQLREKGLEWQPEADGLTVVRDVAQRWGALVSANDRADLAAFTGVDVLHVGQHDIPPRLARRLLGPDALIGLSTHDPDQLAAAIEDPDVDYFCVGPVWATPTKQGRAPVGLDLPRLAARLAPPFTPGAKPWFVTGGVDASTLDEVLDTGARRVVVVRGITQADEPGSVAAALAARLRAA